MPKEIVYNYRATVLLLKHLISPTPMVKPLAFKGDKPAKKRKRPTADQEDDDTSSSIPTTSAVVRTLIPADEDTNPDDNTWVTAELPTDIAGPIIFILPTNPPTCLATDANGKVFASPLHPSTDEPHDLSTAEPHDVRQVWVANRVAGTEHFTFKGHHRRYLGCDKVGVVGATKEAVGPEEGFLCVPAPDSGGMFGVQTVREGFLTVEEEMGKDKVQGQGQIRIRGDAGEVGFSETVRIRMQARFKPRLKRDKAERAREKISRKELEGVVGRRLEEGEVRMLKRARREGNYHEVMLDVKVKGKHDKFA